MEATSFVSLSWLIALQFVLYAVGWGLFAVLLRSERAAVAHFSFYMLLTGFAFELSAGRTELREWGPYVGSSLAYVCAWSTLRRGLSLFQRMPTDDRELLVTTAVVGIVLIAAGPGAEHASLRVALTYGTGAWMMARMILKLRQAMVDEFGLRTAVLATMPAVVLVLGFGGRVIHQIVDWQHPLEMQVASGFNRNLLVSYLVGAATFNFSFMAFVTLRLVRKLREQAHHDPLTGLPNRRALEQNLQTAWQQFQTGSGAFAVVALDLDHFKRINDQFGHLAGDAVLEQLGRRLRASVREYDVVARTGGEEFTVLMRGATPEQAQARAQDLLEAVRAAPFCLPGHELKVTASGGLTLSRASDTSVLEVVQRADGALYRAKERGRDRLELAAA